MNIISKNLCRTCVCGLRIYKYPSDVFRLGGWHAGKIHTLNVVLLWQSEAECSVCVCEGAHVCILSEVGSSLVEATFRPSVQEMKEG